LWEDSTPWHSLLLQLPLPIPSLEVRTLGGRVKLVCGPCTVTFNEWGPRIVTLAPTKGNSYIPWPCMIYLLVSLALRLFYFYPIWQPPTLFFFLPSFHILFFLAQLARGGGTSSVSNRSDQRSNPLKLARYSYSGSTNSRFLDWLMQEGTLVKQFKLLNAVEQSC
jgi:hypothetical protein